eukprot:1157224-Pelagomonas_calceolata.AAC.23
MDSSHDSTASTSGHRQPGLWWYSTPPCLPTAVHTQDFGNHQPTSRDKGRERLRKKAHSFARWLSLHLVHKPGLRQWAKLRVPFFAKLSAAPGARAVCPMGPKWMKQMHQQQMLQNWII